MSVKKLCKSPGETDRARDKRAATDPVQRGAIWRYFEEKFNRISDRLSMELKEKEGCGLGSGEEPGMGLLSSATRSSCACQGLGSNTMHRNHSTSQIEWAIEIICAFILQI